MHTYTTDSLSSYNIVRLVSYLQNTQNECMSVKTLNKFYIHIHNSYLILMLHNPNMA